MAQTLKLKRSAVSGNIPSVSDLALGEIAINTYDGTIFIKKNDGSDSIVTFEPGGTGNSGTIEENNFTGNGSTTAFTLSNAPSSEENLLVFIDSAFQNRDAFTISGTTLTFDDAPDNATSVRIYHVIPGSVDDGILTVAKFAGSAIVTEAEGIASNDNDTTLPTSAAVKDYVDSQVATADTLSEIIANGNTTGGTDIAFADNDKAIFGAGSDLQIYHNGTDSVINNITGDLYITNKTDDGDIIFRTDDGSGGFTSYIQADGSTGEVKLYHYGAKKLATTSQGIDITGQITTDFLMSSGITNFGNIIVTGTVDGVDIAARDAILTSTTTTANAALPKAGGTMTGDLTLSGSDPIITFQDTSANSDPSGRIVFSEVSGTNNFDINYNGANDRLEFRGLVSGVQQDLVYIKRNASTPLSVLGNISVTGTVDGRDVATDGTKLDTIETSATADQTQAEINALGITATGLSGTPNVSIGNITTTGYLRGPSTFTIDPATHGDDTGTLVIAGNLQVDGTTTTINSTTLTVDDKLVTLASGSANAAAANGAGIEVDISGATNPSLTYTAAEDRWNFNKKLYVPDNIRIAAGGPSLILQDTTDDDDHSIRFMDSGGTSRMSITTLGDNLNFETTGSREFTFMGDTSGSGNVGIGTTSPSSLLHLNSSGGHEITSTLTGQETFKFVHGTSGFYAKKDNVLLMGLTQNHDLTLYNTSGAEYARFDGSSGNVGIGTTTPTNTDYGSVVPKLHVKQSNTTGAFNLVARFEAGGDANETGGAILINHSNDRGMLIEGGRDGSGSAADDDGVGHLGILTSSGAHTRMITLRQNKVGTNGVYNVGIGTTAPQAKLQVEEYGVDTTTTSTTATTQVAIHSFAAATFRSARFTVQITNSTDSTYHLTEILMIHDGTTPSITEYGTIFTGSAEATFDADISSGNVRLLATPATTDSMAFKVVAHTITT